MSNRTLLTEMLKTRLQDDDSVLTPLDLDDALSQALSEYSRRAPYSRIGVLTGTGTATLFAVPTEWQRDWSAVLSMEAPAGQIPPAYLEADAWSLYQDVDDTLKIRLVTAPGASTTVRVRYTALHTASATTTTVPSRHYVAVATLGASIAALMLALHYAPRGDTSFQADVSDHAGRSERYAERAKDLRARFDSEVPDPLASGANGNGSGGHRQFFRVVRT